MDGVCKHIHREVFNGLLNLSQLRLERDIGHQRVNALIEQFRIEAEENEELWLDLYTAPDPYRWLYERSQQQRPN